MSVRAHVYVSGRVQGVFFRQNAKQKASSLGLVGWVRNLPDGRVEAVFEGDPVAVKKMVHWCHTGPEYAGVDGVEAMWDEPPEGFGEFYIRY